ncbi:geranylgeranylglyceryl phosphate synthase [Pontibacillus halophilus JSM 076056 = DSM 19796]|uniref:Heptaprenylglyceryl phosphate synthase n=1 Tax=Pontibacillus halophilus JSM 076056 = DSM 19796 TaxID=1385510 RepID=A0A0A5GE05_9BACI|nr:heptaprenylglyceryl phosphate synthase [Pontibacillus halophilus]KGX90229.1 geranylgeranylglyceryl phosphate synthase [Pontibacillus halophilus JSM 076056 = DSM 19796]
MNEIKQWEHVFKLDPNKHISDDDLEKVCESGTDAIIVGGTDDVTFEGVLDLLARIRRYEVPCALEVSNHEAITPGFDYVFIPTVLNSRDREWILGAHHQAVKEYGDLIDWDELFLEGYCILNPDAKAFAYSNSIMPDEEDVIAYARMAEHFFHLPIFYMEYSGMYGDPSLVQKVSKTLDQTRLFYGGGIATSEDARTMAAYADTVIVGNSIYENLEAALKTVQAVKNND